MRFVTISIDGEDAWGYLKGDTAIIVSRAPGWKFPTLRDAIAAGALETIETTAAGAPTMPLADVIWRPLIPAPGKIICVGINYAKHREETQRPVTTYPMIFMRFADSQTAHEAPIL